MSEPSRRWISIDRSGVSSMPRAVDMRPEGHALLVDLAQLGERHHLEAAGIGQDRPRPVHELMQAAERCDALGAGPQHQVIGVGEHDIGAERLHRLRMHRLDRRRRADRHEGGRADLSARRRDRAGARRAVGRDQTKRSRKSSRMSCSAAARCADTAGRRRHSCRSDSPLRSHGHRPRASSRDRRRPQTSMNSVERGRWKLVSSTIDGLEAIAGRDEDSGLAAKRRAIVPSLCAADFEQPQRRRADRDDAPAGGARRIDRLRRSLRSPRPIRHACDDPPYLSP